MKEVVSFRKNILANTKELLTSRIKGKGRIETLRVRFYSGQEMDLRVSPMIVFKGNRLQHMISYPNGVSSYLSGDNDSFKFDLDISVENDDEIHILVENVETVYNYDVVVDVNLRFDEWGDV